MIRQPIVTMMGHVDHGKTSVLDNIRGTAVAAKEAGGITQAIGASIIPLETINAVAGPLLTALKIDLTIPGLLFIDTPGHAAFTNLRKRGGNLADIVVLVIDVMQGIQPQTQESIEILKLYKTPFVIALNKVDRINGWESKKESLVQSINKQATTTQSLLDAKLYEVVGKMHEAGIEADRFDRISDHAKQVAIVPISAKSGDGIPELLMVLSGLAQRFLTESLEIDENALAKGTLLEIKDETGRGKVMDIIIYDGRLRIGDDIVVGGADAALAGKVKSIFLPSALGDMREKRTKFESVKDITAATGARINVPGMEDAAAGMPLRGATPDNINKVKLEVEEEVHEVLLETGERGVVIKAESLGSVEALLRLLKEQGIPVKKARIGQISKADMAVAEAMKESDPYHAVVLGFNVEGPTDAPVKIITNQVIYKIIEDYQAWVEGERANRRKAERDQLPSPARIMILRGYVFRQNNPAVVGVDVQIGTLKPGTQLMKKDGVPITNVKTLQHEQESVDKAEKNKQVAVSMPDVTVGRQIHEGDVLYTYIDEKDFRALKEVRDQLTNDEKEVLREIAAIMREQNPMWGV